jgi:hypothetical protein
LPFCDIEVKTYIFAFYNSLFFFESLSKLNEP